MLSTYYSAGTQGYGDPVRAIRSAATPIGAGDVNWKYRNIVEKNRYRDGQEGLKLSGFKFIAYKFNLPAHGNALS